MIAALALVAGCADAPPAPPPEPAIQPVVAEPDPAPPVERRLTLLAVGDVLPHRRVKATAARHPDNR